MSTAQLERERTGFAVADFVRPPDPASLPFMMPHVTIGKIVNFFPNCVPTNKPIPAVVMDMEARRVVLGSVATHLRIGDVPVRHCSDPITLNPYEKVNGCWDFTPDDKQRMAEINLLAYLVRCVGELADKAGVKLPALKQPLPAPVPIPGFTPEPVDDSPVPELTDEEREAQRAALLASMEQEAGELETENVPVPRAERINRKKPL